MIDQRTNFPLVDYVIDGIDNYSLLNANDLPSSETIFTEKLLSNLPKTSQLKRRSLNQEGKGAVVYDAGTELHPFILKKYDLSSIEGGNNFDEKFQILKAEYERALQYFGNKMPATVVFERLDENGEREMMVAQDIVKGPQLKMLMESKKSLDQPLTVEMKLDIQEILLSCMRMFEETGYVLDFDLIFNFEANNVKIFDFGSQGKTHYWNTDAMVKLKELGIQVPEALDLGFIDLT